MGGAPVAGRSPENVKSFNIISTMQKNRCNSVGPGNFPAVRFDPVIGPAGFLKPRAGS